MSHLPADFHRRLETEALAAPPEPQTQAVQGEPAPDFWIETEAMPSRKGVRRCFNSVTHWQWFSRRDGDEIEGVYTGETLRKAVREARRAAFAEARAKAAPPAPPVAPAKPQPLTEPVTIAKALLAGRSPEVWDASGCSDVSCVALANIQMTGWGEKAKAVAYADAYGRALRDYRSAIASAAPAAKEQG